MNPSRREMLKATGIALGLASSSAAATVAIRPPASDPLDLLYDELAAAWAPMAEADQAVDEDEFLDTAAREGYELKSDAAWRSHVAAGYACRHAYCKLVRAVAARAEIGEVSRVDYASIGRPLATVRTARRRYILMPDSSAEWNDDQDVPGWGLSFEVVAIDL